MASTHVVVDGSNLATEGRTLPSLSQLEEAVSAYLEEHPDADVVVVVDATFEHRIDAKDRDRLKEAELNGEVVSPPAGTVGRGDAFVLKIAKRTGGIVLSNDSFQEFHGEHPWLFEEGRLIGGKPVPGVGWIFTPRNPVRGPKSRAATAAVRRNAPKTVPAAKLAVTRPDGSTPKVGDVLTPKELVPAPAEPMRAYALAKELGLDTKGLKELAASVKITFPSHSSTLTAEQVESIRTKAAEPVPLPKVRAYALAKELELDNAALKALAAGIGIVVASHSSSLSGEDAEAIRAAAVAPPEPEPESESAARPRRRRSRGGRGRGNSSGGSSDSGDDGAAEPEKPAQRTAKKATKKAAEPAKKKAAAGRGGDAMAAKGTPINEPLDFLSFIATHEVGAVITGTVSAFTSHGAMVDVALDEGRVFRCYAPTERLGDPPPTKARDVLSRRDERTFRIVAVDAARRVAEVELA
jgi:hypothetical protein